MTASINASTSSGVIVTSDTSGALALQTANTTAMTIDTSQNVGIGTSSPSYKLDIVSANANSVHWKQTSTTSGDGFLYSDNNGSGIFDTASGSGNGMYLYKTGNAIWWNTNATERMRIDSSGNLGLGVTPSAWISTAKAFQINGGYVGSIWTTASGQFQIGNNVYTNSGGNDTYISTNYAAKYNISSTGQHQWYTAASGTAGNAITFTQAMTLDASGNLGIGVTSPTSALYVAAQSDTAGGAGITLGNTTTNRRWLTRFGTNSDLGYYLDFYDGSSWNTRLALTYTGNLLVGTTSSAGRLTINGSTADSTANCVSFRDSSSTSLFIVRDDGRISTGGALSPYSNTTASAANMYVDASGIFYRSTSSLKYKTNVENATHGLADVLKLRPVTYQSKATEDGQIIYGGLIAEEVDAAGLKEFVQYAPDGSPDALAYGNMVSLCIKAIQELSAQVTELKAEVQAFKGA